MSGITAFTPYARVYDPNLKPQNTKSYELGMDLTFLNGLFSLNYTFSRQNVKDQIFEGSFGWFYRLCRISNQWWRNPY